MSFIHDDPEFGDLLRIVAGQTRIAPGLVEKDYWVTHTLWALHDTGFDVWFKGGTSLSKGFCLIERFSEDLDLKILPGTVSSLPPVSNWKSTGTNATAERRDYFAALPGLMRVPGAEVTLGEVADNSWRAADLRVSYPGRHLADLGSLMKPFVLLELGSARTTPAVRCDMTSFVHDYLAAAKQLGSFDVNRPKAVRCVHPLVTLVEKLDALHRRVPREDAVPATFVRHFEDAARVVHGLAKLPPLSDYVGVPLSLMRWWRSDNLRPSLRRRIMRSCRPQGSAGTPSAPLTQRSRPCSGALGSLWTMPATRSESGFRNPSSESTWRRTISERLALRSAGPARH